MRRAWRLWSKLRPWALEGGVEGLFAGVAEGRMADVVDQGEGLGQLGIEAEGAGQGAGDLRDFKGVGEAAAEVVSGRVAGQAGKDLGLAGEAAEGAGVQDAGGVAGKGSAVGVGRLGWARRARALPASPGTAMAGGSGRAAGGSGRSFVSDLKVWRDCGSMARRLRYTAEGTRWSAGSVP